MDRSAIKKWVLITGVMVGNLWIPADADACLLQWLRRRRAERNATFYPTTAVAAAGSCGPAQCQQTVVRYVPQTAFRTVWQAVPVTTYRRTVQMNPANGQPMTCTQPCTTYTYQARRVPYTTYRPVYQTVPVTVGCNSCSTTTAVTTAVPYYTPSTTTTVAPGTTPTPGGATSGATPWTPVPQTPSAPAPTMAPESTTSGSDDPADDRPRIDSNVNGFSSLKRIPSTRPRNTWRSDSATPTADHYFRPSPSTSDPQTASDDRPEASIMATPSSEPPLLDIRPIPRLDPPTSEGSQPPRLLNPPRDNTALLSTRWASNRIAWPERQVTYAENPSRGVTKSRSADHTRRLDPRRLESYRLDADENQAWDETGWTSTRR